MKLGKAIAAAVGAAAAIGAAVYAKKKLSETESPLKKQKSMTQWKSGGEITHTAVIRKPVSETEQAEILREKIDSVKAKPQPEQAKGEAKTEENGVAVPVHFTFTESDDSPESVSFDCVFDHFNRLEKPDSIAECTAVNTVTKDETSAAVAEPVKTESAETNEAEAVAVEQPAESIAETATVEAISAFDELASIAESETDTAEPTETAVAESESETVAEEAISAFDELAQLSESETESVETSEAEAIAIEQPAESIAETATVEAISVFDELAQLADSETETADTSEAEAVAVEQPAESINETATVEAISAFDELASINESEMESAETSEAEAVAVEQPADSIAETATEEAISAFDELASINESETESAETNEADAVAVEQPAESIAEAATDEAISAFDELASINKSETDTAESTETAITDSVAETATVEAITAFDEAQLAESETDTAETNEAEAVAVEQPAESIIETATEEAISAFDELAQLSESETDTAEPAETAVADSVAETVAEEAIIAFDELAQLADSETDTAETSEAEALAIEQPAESETESAEPTETAIADSVAETVAEEAKAEAVIAEKPVDTFDIDASVEEEFRKIMSGHSSDAVIEEENKQIADDDMSDDLSDEVLAQSGGVDSSDNELVGTLPDGAVSAEPEKPRTMDFFDLPDEALKPELPVLEKAPDENVAEVEDLFGSLLIDELEEKNKLSDPSEVFNMFDTDESQDDFDKYQDEKIEEESEKKKTTDTRKYIAQDIADNIASFSQLLEPLNAIKENKIRGKSGILFDWEMRIQALIGDLPIKTYWRNNFRNYEIWSDEKCMEKAGELLSMLELVGIVRDKAKEVVIDKDTLDFYSAQSEHLNNDFRIGETVIVVRPCWKINGRPARKGEIAKKAPFAEFSRKKVSPLETLLRENSCADGDVNIPVTEDNFCTFDRSIPYIKQAIADGFCKCAVRRMEDGGALAFFYEVIADGESDHYPPCTLRFEISLDKNAKVIGRFRGEKV